MTINAIFHEAVAKHTAKTALRYKEDKNYKDITYSELAKRVEEMASGLAALGITKGDRVALLSENRPEWAITDLAVLSLGGVVVPIYPTLPAPQVAYIVRNSEAKALVVSDAKQLKKAIEARKDAPALACLVSMDVGPTSEDANVHTFASILERGRSEPLGAERYEMLWKAVQPEDVASFVYTSGTTGDPKGAMLTHGNFVWDVDAALKHFAAGGEPVRGDDTLLSFLPMSHAYERTAGYYLPLRVGATIGYCEGVRTLTDDMAAVKPTLMVCVPRVYEAIQERVLDTVAKAEPKRQALFHKALAAGAEYAERKRTGKAVGPILALKHAVFDALVLAKVRERFGGRFRFLVSGGAALNPETARFFEAIGIPISEGYGMTEASPVMSANPVNRAKIGTVGTVLPGGEFKIASDGEILYRGPNVMKGYWKNDAATAEMIDADGWLHTGDVGMLDGDSYLKITDRKKDILVLANGKNVAPQPIESVIKQSPFISEIVLIGDKQSIITALVLPNKGKLTEWAKGQELAFESEEALLNLPEVRKKIKQEIDANSRHLADFERVKKFTLLPVTFSIETGELTPTLKIKRKVVAQKFAREIAEMRGEVAEVAA
jgi:long-chain acyl-CoA synthetase